MCHKLHYIFNKYTHQRVLVKCGKCAACQQEKADLRTFRIRNAMEYGSMTYFVLLEYDNDHIPYFDRNEISEGFVPLYRGFGDDKEQIDSIYFDKLSPDLDTDLLPHLRHCQHREAVGVLYYEDIKDFFKRVRSHLKYHHGYKNITFKYFSCLEYGPTSYRPHSHLLITFDARFAEEIRAAIVASWTFMRSDRLRNNIRIARDAASYCSSYVNRGSHFPLFFALKPIRPRHHYSKRYGFANQFFNLNYILSASERNDLSYPVESSSEKGGFASFLIPKYVINTFFPIFKGFSRIPPASLVLVLQHPERLPGFFDCENEFRKIDLHKIKVSLKNASAEFYRILGIPIPPYSLRLEYFRAFVRAWSAYQVTRLRLFYYDDDFENRGYYNYDNLGDVICGKVKAPNLVNSYGVMYESMADYNSNPYRLANDFRKERRFNKMLKQRKVTNQCMVAMNFNV